MIRTYTATGLIGGTNGKLDNIDAADVRGDGTNIALADGDTAMVVVFGDQEYFYSYDADSAAAESSPDIIQPDANAGDGRWVRVNKDYLPGAEQELTCADAVTIDWASGATAYMTFDRATAALTLANGVNGEVYRLLLIQDATGSRVVTWVTTVKWRGGSAPTLSTAANAIDIITLVKIAGVFYGDISAGFAEVV